MTLINFQPHPFRKSSLTQIQQANDIIAEYESAGYQLTLRQLYYQFVARDLLENSQRNYKSLGNTISKARLAGLVSWDAIADNGRNAGRRLIQPSVEGAFTGLAGRYALDLWRDQDHYVEVWVEKDALSGIIKRPANKWGVAYLACKGFLSSSEMYEASKRFARAKEDGQRGVLIHLGDHDPSGIDMTRDNGTRLKTMWQDVEIRRVALNMDQIEEYSPPPNPAKTTDSRYDAYRAEHGDESWELDALEPSVIESIIDEEIRSIVDIDLFDATSSEEQENERILRRISMHADEVLDWARENL